MSFCRTCTLPPYWQGAKDREWKKYPVSIYVILVEKRKYRLLTDGRCVVARTGRAVDHHLTTLPLGSSPCGNFHVPTSFSLRNNQCRNLCTLHKSLRWFIAFSRMSQFSDSVGRWFESSRAHQNSQRTSLWEFSFAYNNVEKGKVYRNRDTDLGIRENLCSSQMVVKIRNYS